MKNSYREELLRCFNDLKNKKTIYRQIPNMLTVSRVIGVIPINILYFTGNVSLALIFSVILFVTDFFDGRIARKYNIVSEFGAKLDAVCDKIMVLGLAIPLISNKLLILINLFLEGLISGVNLIKEKKGVSTGSSYIGKVKTWLLSFTLGFGYLSVVLDIPNLLFNIFSLSTALMEGVTLRSYLVKSKELDIFEDNTYVSENNNIDDNTFKDNSEKLEYLKREKEKIIGSLISDKTVVKKLERK